uniref:YadA C-terminal domain-containing protein n=1 Tax=Fusobacterium massiliense TaxID=1852365 RepID=UPI0028D3C931
TSPTGALVTDTLVKQGLDGKLDKDLSNLDTSKLNEKLAKGNITSTDITVTGGNNSTFKDVTLNLSEALKNKINSVDDKLNKKGDNLTNDEKIALLKNLGLDNIPTVANLDNKLNKNGDNLEKEAFTTNLTKGANIDTPTNTVVTDKMVKDKLDSMNTDLGSKLDNKANKDLSNLTNEDKGKARTNLDVYSKSETDNKLNEKADKSDLTKYVKLDGSNIDKTAKDKLTEKLSEGANLDTPTNTLVTDTIVKTKLDNLKTDLDNKLDKKANASDVYTKNELDAKLKNTVAPKAEGDILSDTLEITNGKDRLIGKEDVKIELKDKSVTKEKLSDELTKNIDNKANINGNNIVNKKDKEDFRNNIDVYSKNEIDSKISNISTETNLDGEIKENEEKGVKGKVIDKHLKENYVHKNDMEIRDKVIISNSAEIQANKEAIKANAKEIKRVDAKINKVAAISQATASLDWGQISVGNVGVGASIAQYSNETGIAVGVAYRPTDNFFMNMKWTGLAGEPHYNSIGASATYQFNLK